MAHDAIDTAPENDAALERALIDTPRGALALAGIATALLLAAWLAIYLFAFLPRGPES